MSVKEKSTLEIISSIRKAIQFEIEHQYINAIGKTADFTNFVISKANEALRFFPDSVEWRTIIQLVKRYHLLDQISRMSIVNKIIESLNELEEFYEREFSESKFLKTLEKDLGISNQYKTNEDISELNVQYVKGVGPLIAKKLQLIGIHTVEDLLHYYPREHISYSDVTYIRDLKEEMDATILGQILSVTAFQSPKKKLIILTITIKDASGKLKINKYFQGNSIHYYLKQYKQQYPTGSHVICVGKVKYDKFLKQKTLHNAVVEIISEDFTESDRDSRIHTAKIVPIYALTEGLSLMFLRKIIFNALETYKDNIKEFIPESIIKANNFISYANAIEEIHFPNSIENKNKAASRLLFNDFFLMQLRFMQIRNEHKKKPKGIKFNCFENSLIDKFIDSLPFTLTYAQKRVFFNEILPDMVSSQPMHRLVQGDVGSGKTVVAFLSLLVAVADGYQAAIMVPTEILAEQHYKKFVEWINNMREDLKLKPGILIGKQKAKEKKLVLEGIKDGSINIVVGTHALIQETVEFKKLGLVVIDEQHRFGVKQRELLARKAETNSIEKTEQLGLIGDQIHRHEEELEKINPNIEKLFMTATPIPRTLTLALYGDLDMSEIDEMPTGRLPIITRIIDRKINAYELIKSEIAMGNQAYIVFPLIDESEALSAKAATVEYERLKQSIFQNYRIGLIHGKLKDEEKENIMQNFRNKEIDILVSTTVIEVGVDIPDATVMLIESSERFGLAQLHQLRGRVGRSNKQSYCLLSYTSKSENVIKRLSVLVRTNNGFLVAQEDLKIRGAGDLTGLKQSGLPDSVLQGLIDQEDILIHARNAARKFIEENPNLNNQELLKKKLEKSYAKSLMNAG